VLARCASDRRQCRPRHTAVSARKCVCQCFIIAAQSDRVSGDGPCAAANTTRHHRTSRCPAVESAAASEPALGRGRTVANFAQGRHQVFVSLANLLVRACKFRFDSTPRELNKNCASAVQQTEDADGSECPVSLLRVRSARGPRSTGFVFLSNAHKSHTLAVFAVSRRQGERTSERKSRFAPQLERTPASSSVYAHRSTHCLVYSDQAICKPNVCHAIYSSEKLHDA
jgi:hypothetical protein